MTQISRFIGEVVPVAQRVTGDRGESAAPEGGGGFADYALVSLHCLRIYLDSSYRMTIDLLKEMPQITGEIGLNAAFEDMGIIGQVISDGFIKFYDEKVQLRDNKYVEPLSAASRQAD